MRRLFALILGCCFGAALMYVAFQYHIVRTPEQWLLLPKSKSSLELIYADVREWKLPDWEQHPEFAKAVIDAGHGDLVITSASKSVWDLFPRFRGSQRPQRRSPESP